MKELTLKANRSIQEKLEEMLDGLSENLLLTVIKEDGKEQHYRIVPKNTDPSGNPVYDMYIGSDKAEENKDAFTIIGAIEYSSFLLW